MAVSFGCKCPERRKPLTTRKWRVMTRKLHHSAFSGYHSTPSDYSTVVCLGCNAIGRTKARYVSSLKDLTTEENKAWRA